MEVTMSNLFIKLPFQNESALPVKLILEPLSEYFIIQPNQKVEAHAICNATTSNTFFTVAVGNSSTTLYAPGEISGFVDCYITHDGKRLVPDGN
jgi:hypothetical protein